MNNLMENTTDNILLSKFIKELGKKLIQRDHIIISTKEEVDFSQEMSSLVLVRNNSPVFYVVNIVNTTVGEEATFQIKEDVSAALAQNMGNYGCSHCIFLNLLLYTDNKTQIETFVDNKDSIKDDNLSQVFWGVNLVENTIFFGSKQPSKLANYEKSISQALETYGTNQAEENIAQFINEVSRKEDALRRGKTTRTPLFLIGVNVIIFVAMVFGYNHWVATSLFANDSVAVLQHFQFYRLVTSMFLHGSLMHLAYNCLSLYIFGSRLEMYLGQKRFLIVYFISGICGSIASVFLTRGVSLGASGAVFGIVGAVLALSHAKDRAIGGLSYFTLLLFVVVGIGSGFLEAGIDNFAHIGGLFAGFILQKIFVHFDMKKSVDTKSYPQ